MRPRSDIVRESSAELNELREYHKSPITSAKLLFLHYLRDHPDRPIREAADHIGISLRRARHWWSCYKSNGLNGLLNRKTWREAEVVDSIVRSPYTDRTKIDSNSAIDNGGSDVNLIPLLSGISRIQSITNSIEWSSQFRELIVSYLSEIDYAVIRIRSSANLLVVDGDAEKIVLLRDTDATGQVVESVADAKSSKNSLEKLVASGKSSGFDFNRYHFPPVVLDLAVPALDIGYNNYGDGAEVYVGTLYFFRLAISKPFSLETFSCVERLRPFLSYVFASQISRFQLTNPTVTQFSTILNSVKGKLPFTPREEEVLTLLLMGNSEKDAATALNISIKTVESHVRSAYRKCGVSRLNELFARYSTAKSFSHDNQEITKLEE